MDDFLSQMVKRIKKKILCKRFLFFSPHFFSILSKVSKVYGAIKSQALHVMRRSVYQSGGKMAGIIVEIVFWSKLFFSLRFYFSRLFSSACSFACR